MAIILNGLCPDFWAIVTIGYLLISQPILADYLDAKFYRDMFPLPKGFSRLGR